MKNNAIASFNANAVSKPRVYVETSDVSYLAARPSRDVLIFSRQEQTHLWWDSVDKSLLTISDLVILEISRGDPIAASRRLDLVKQIVNLTYDAQAQALSVRLMDAGLVPHSEAEDALHIAQATLTKCDYILSWNFAHFVNPQAKVRLFTTLNHWGYRSPLLVTPQELLESATTTIRKN